MSASNYHRTPRQIFWSLSLIGLAAMVFTAAALLWMARAYDRTAAEDAERLILTAKDGFKERLATTTEDYAWWQEAYENVRDRDDAAVYSNIGSGANAGPTFDVLVILDPAGTPIYGWQTDGGQTSDPTLIPQEVTDMMRRALDPIPLDVVDAVVDFAIIDGHITAIAATRISPYDMKGLTSADFPILITGLRLTEDRVAEFEDQLLLEDLRAEPSALVQVIDRDGIDLVDATGAAVANLSWKRPSPGSTVLIRLLPIFAIAGTLFFIMVMVAGRLSSRQAKDILAARLAAWRSARSDGLTQLLNRTGFTELDEDPKVVDALRKRRTALVYIDLNRFKSLNDSVGHEAGDIALEVMAQRMRNAARQTDILARIGGDEFIALIFDSRPEEAAKAFADRLLKECSVPVRLGEDFHLVSAAIGVATVRSPEDRLDDLMNRADVAMYVSKGTPSGAVTFYSEDLDRNEKARRAIEHRLRSHLSRVEAGTSGFHLAFQPIIDRDTETISSAEVLLRWTDEELGVVGPDQFIPVAEACNLVQPLGDFVLQEACRALADWPQLRLSVNVSPLQLLDHAFTQKVIGATRSYGIDPERLILEITENALIEVPEVARERIEALTAAGFAFALDDFGTGFASISYLERFPFSILKVDRSFVTGIGEDPRADMLFQSIVQMARAFSLEVVAEGVENAEQSQRIRLTRCNMEQGYLHAKPMPLDQMRDLFEADGRRNQATGT